MSPKPTIQVSMDAHAFKFRAKTEMTFQHSSLQMDLAANFPAIGLRSSKLLPPLNLHFSCGIQRKISRHTSPIVFSQIRKHHRQASISANFSGEKSEGNIELPSYGKTRRIHFIGVGGSGLSGLAMLALKQGYAVSGSDVAWSSYMDALKEAGALLYIGHSESNLLRQGYASIWPDKVVVSSAIPSENVEILMAESCEVPVYKRGAWLGKITKDYNLIAVSGSHGKSTTTGMLAYVLKVMGDDLTAVIGAQVPQFYGCNVIYGNGHNFVLEADEYDGCFLELYPNVAIVTNIDWEHVDMFQDKEAVVTVFRKFIGQIRDGGHLILCGDRHDGDQGMFSLLNDPNEAADAPCSRYKVTTFGMSSCNEWQASSVSLNSHGGFNYKLCHKGQAICDISLQIPGVHNVLNSLAVIAALGAILCEERQLYKSIDLVKSHLTNFTGISRRLEFIGAIRGYHIFDDYAHHPTEVNAVLQAARAMFSSKELLVVFQPHSFSRMAAMKSEFASALSEADHVVITEIYAARETNIWGISGKDLAMSITSSLCDFIPCLETVVDKLVDMVSKEPGRQMVILTLGAGDITKVGRKLFQELQQNGR